MLEPFTNFAGDLKTAVFFAVSATIFFVTTGVCRCWNRCHQCYIWRFLLLPAFLLLRRTTTFCYYRAFFCYYRCRCMQVLEQASFDATSGSNDGVATAFLLPPVIADAGSGVLRSYIRQAMMLRPATLHWMLQQAIVGAGDGGQRRRR